MFRLFRSNKDFGNRGERLAVKFLRRQGYKILERNFRLKSGEIDVIAKDGDQIVFVEVKTRSSNNQEFLRASINRAKERRIAKTASYYLGKEKYHGLKGRFDVVLIVNNNGRPNIEHIKNAFMMG